MLKFVSEPEHFRAWIDQYGFNGKLLFVGMILLQVVVAIIPGEPLEIGAGYAFGIWEGTILCMIGFLLGSTVIYLLGKRFRKPLLTLFFSEEKIQSLWFLRNSPKRNSLIFLLMIIPGTPKDLISYIVSMTDIKLLPWLGIVTVTRIPSLITSVIGGNALGLKNYQFAILVFVGTLLISGLGMLIYQKICKYHRRRLEEKKSAKVPASKGTKGKSSLV